MKRGNFGRIGVFGEDGIFSLKENYASQTGSSQGSSSTPAGYEYLRGMAITNGTLFTATSQGNGDYVITGTALFNSSSTSQRSDIFTVESNPYIELKYGADGTWSGSNQYCMMGFVAGSTGFSGTVGYGAMYYAGNANIYPGTFASGITVPANGDIFQFGLDSTTRTVYISKNDSATIYSRVILGTDPISFVFGSGASATTTVDFLSYGKNNMNYIDSFISKTGINFTPTGWEA